VLTFGQIADITGSTALGTDALPDIGALPDTDALNAWLHERYPRLQHLKYMIAVDKRSVRENTPLSSHSVVALLPPFSGG